MHVGRHCGREIQKRVLCVWANVCSIYMGVGCTDRSGVLVWRERVTVATELRLLSIIVLMCLVGVVDKFGGDGWRFVMHLFVIIFLGMCVSLCVVSGRWIGVDVHCR